MLLRVLVEALEALDKVLFLVVWHFLHHIDHKDPIATVTQTWCQEKSLILRVVNYLRLCPSIDVVVQEDAFLEEHIHLVVLIVASLRPRLLVDIQVEHLLEVANVDLVRLQGFLGQLFRQKVSIRGHETVNDDLIALHVDASENTIVRDTHHNHLILIVASALLLESDALGCKFSLGVIGYLVLILATPIPTRASIEARHWMLLIYTSKREGERGKTWFAIV